jgi:hypothetical protein
LTTTGLPHLRFRTAAALAFSLIATLLAPPTLAQGRKAACATRGHTAHVHCTAHARKGPHTHAGKRHQAVHGVLVHHPTAPIVPRNAAPAGATCEDGSVPAGPRGALACADGSEPTCTDGSSSPTGKCQASSEADFGGGQPTCEDAPVSACGPAEEDPASACHEAPSQGPPGQGAGFVCEG